VELSDERGRFSLVVPEGRYALTATAPGGTAAYLPPRALAGEAEIVLRLGEPGAGFRLAGRVTGEDGQGVDGARIECLRYSDEGGDVFYTRTGSDGRYEITLLRAHHQCSARKGERLARGVAIADGTARRDFILFAAGPAPAPVVDWIRDNAIPLLSVRAEHGFADMKPLRKLIGKARIVGLGEATHGTREFFQMKHRMLEFLVSEMGFTVFAIEATWPESEAVNEYVLTGKGDPATALAGMHFMVWNTEEVLELIEWMRRWNADPRHKRKVKFYGFDMQMSSVALARLLEFLEKVDAELADATRQRLGVLAEKNRKISREAIVENADAMKESLAELRRRLERGRRIYARKAGKRSSLKARQALRILEQFVEMTTAANPGALRDSSMAENLRWIADVAEPGAKIVAWAHNGHIATTARDGVTVMMGHHLEQALGAGYLRIGFAFHRGSFQAIAMNGDRRGLVEHTIGPAPPGSIGDTFQRAGWPLFVLDLRRLPRAGVVADWFAAGQIARATGIAFSSEEAMRGLVVLPDRFEALIFVESTTRARPTRTGHRAPR
jgi:erythromycin esterase